MALLAVVVTAATGSAQPTSGPGKGHPSTCDGRPVTDHLTRARHLLREAYRSGPDKAKIAAAQAHRRCIRIAKVRKQIGEYRDRLKADLEQREVWGSCEDNPPAASKAVYDCIAGAAAEHGTPVDWMMRIASCESHYNPRAYNPSGASGLFQFMPSTFASTPYGGQSIWSARANSLAAAWMYTQGRAGEWACN